MALEQYSLAALIDQQMLANGAALSTVPRHSVGAAYFWNVLGVELRKARPFPRRVASPAKEGSAAADEATRRLELV